MCLVVIQLTSSVCYRQSSRWCREQHLLETSFADLDLATGHQTQSKRKCHSQSKRSLGGIRRRCVRPTARQRLSLKKRSMARSHCRVLLLCSKFCTFLRMAKWFADGLLDSRPRQPPLPAGGACLPHCVPSITKEQRQCGRVRGHLRSDCSSLRSARHSVSTQRMFRPMSGSSSIHQARRHDRSWPRSCETTAIDHTCSRPQYVHPCLKTKGCTSASRHRQPATF
mmetsp:Transcript_18095/g.45368  ORF Transcript_18095/g.45368 Transcript_18095/m.45368 type:complete len:225 (+) Transcript_18095:588-1262(+)